VVAFFTVYSAIYGRKLSVRISIFLLLLCSAFILPSAARADAIDDFVLTGDGMNITFSLPASPPGNESKCPTGIITSCVPGPQTAFYLDTLVTINGVTSEDSLAFPTARFGGGLSLGDTPGRLFGEVLFTPDAGTPTFLPGTFELYGLDFTGFPPELTYSLTITPETIAATPEPSTLGLFGTGVLGLIGVMRNRRSGASR